jgi:hypothetical protein
MILIRVGSNEEVYTPLSNPNWENCYMMIFDIANILIFINRIRAICGST